MSRKNHTEIVCIIDRSGSMSSIREDAIGGFNSFIESQKNVDGTASVSLILFDHEYNVVYENIELSEVESLNSDTFVPRGSTALFDAIGKTINSVGNRLHNTSEENRPEKVMVCILTDGCENASIEFTNENIKEMIEHQREKYSWEFSFLAANQDAFSGAKSMGISDQYTMNFMSTGDGTRSAMKTMSDYTSSYRTSF